MSNDRNKLMRRKVRSSYAISTASIALVLFLLGTVGYLIINAVSATNHIRESITVNVMLKSDLPDGHKQVGKRLKEFPEVKKVEFVPKDKAAEEFKAYIGDDFEEFLGENPLPDSYRVTMGKQGSQKEFLEGFEKTLLSWDEVDEVLYQKGVIEQINANIDRFLLVILFFGGTLLVIAVVLLNNTIRAVIYSKRHIINTMKLVGATRWFILRPFMRSSVLQGIYAALIASAMFLLLIAGLHRGLPSMTLALQNSQLVAIMACMLLGGVLISLVFTTFAVDKYIKMRTHQLYL